MIEAQKWLGSHVPSLKGKRVLITGGTSGIGYEAAKALAYKGAAVTIACRSEAKAALAREAITKDIPSAEIDFVYYDQADPVSIAKVVEELKTREFFSIVLNAGVFNPPKELCVCPDGTSLTFQTNAVGTYLLFKGLAKTHAKSRYVFVNSIANRYPKRGDYSKYIHRCEKDYFDKYEVSKRAVMAIYETAYEKTALDVTMMHPGITQTQITRGYHKWFRRLANGFMRLFFHPAWRACLGIVLLASGEGARGAYSVPGDWWHINGYPRLIAGPHKKSAKGADSLMKLFESVYGI
jgi:NAD(P)-dependent dehydrogenase (short-subunit alcohol dehydrogenase family)